MARSRRVHDRDASRGRGRRGEDFGDVQPALLAHRTAFDVDSGEPAHEGGHGFDRRRGRRWGLGQPGSAARELGAARAVGQEAEVPDADEAVRDDVEKKATDEFLSRERHDLHAVAVGVVSPAETHDAVGVADEPLVGDRDGVGVPPRYSRTCVGPATGRLAYTTQSGCRRSRSQVAKASGSAREASEPAKRSLPVVKARCSACRYLPRKTRARARTGNRKPGGAAIQRAPSWVSAPPVTTQCRCRCWERFWPQVWRIAGPPASPPRWRGSRPKVVSVAATARKSSV